MSADKSSSAYQAAAAEALDELLAKLKSASKLPGAEKFARASLKASFRDKFNDRAVLGVFADTGRTYEFIATVSNRGFHGKTRTVLLKDLRVFGVKFILEDHLWVEHTKLWQRIEPFLQGQKVILRGQAVPYARGDGSQDFTIVVEKLVKL